MTEKRFTKVEHIFELNDEGVKDNQTRIEYYYALDLIDLLNELSEENEQLKETIKELELENAKHIGDGEWDIRDITYGHGKFRLEEWGERYHQFYNGDKQLEDEEVVSLLFENEKLKEELKSFEQVSFTDLCDGSRTVLYMKKENGDSE